MDNTVRTRFAPSPTGFMHIGNLRTALYSYLYARANNGKFILRIEDTDQKRYVDGAVEVIYNTLKTAGISHDEGPDVGGGCGPYVQSERAEIYKKYALELVKRGYAYYCFCDRQEPDEELPQADGHSGYDRKCRSIPPEEAEKRAETEPYVIRQKMPLEGATVYDDAVYGQISVDNEQLDDQVLLKRDGMPTYNFANVIDDHLMGITHVFRGTEYIVSTPKYKLLYEAYGWQTPVFVHLPLIMGQNEDGSISKLSKRHGATGFEQLMEMGYLPEAVINYVALLGWSPKRNEEIFSMSQLEEMFNIDGIGKSESVFDYAKLDWMNSQYISALSDEEFEAKGLVFAGELGCLKGKWPLIAKLLKTRLCRLDEIPEKVSFLLELPEYSTELYINKKNKTDCEKSLAVLKAMLPIFEKTDKWENDVLFAASAEYAASNEVKTGFVMWPVRIAVSGLSATPGGATEIMEIIGKEESLKRINKAIAMLEGTV